MRFSPRSSFARTLLLIVTLLFVSLVTTYLVVLNFAILPSLQQFNKVLAYEVRMLMTDKLQLEDGTQLVVPPAFRREIYRELGISLYSNEAAEDAGLRWAQHYEFLSQQMAQQLGGPTEVRVEVNKSSPVVWLKTWLSPNIWVRVPLTEIHQGDFSPLFRYTLAIMLLAIGARGCSSAYKTDHWSTWSTRRFRSVKGLFHRRCVNMARRKCVRLRELSTIWRQA
jgi:two-component system osmolarity sensor histidine kinase EnvZ